MKLNKVSTIAVTIVVGLMVICSTSFNNYLFKKKSLNEKLSIVSSVDKLENQMTNQNSMEAAYTDAAKRANPDFLSLEAGGIGGKTFTPNLYEWLWNNTHH